MNAPEPSRTYRFSPLDREGMLLGLGGAQCAAIAAGLFSAATLVQSGFSAAASAAPLVLGAVFALGRWGGQRLDEWAPVILRFGGLSVAGRRRWLAEVPLFAKGQEANPKEALPPFLRGLRILDAGPVNWGTCSPRGTAVVWDERERTLSASLRVRSREFSLLDRPEQERIIQLWGDALGAFCVERGAVVRAAASEWMAPVGVGRGDLSGIDGSRCDDQAVASYLDLLAEAAPRSVHREVVVTVTVDLRRIRAAGRTRRAEEAGTDVLLEELRLLASRLDAAGLKTDGPLSPAETAETLRLRLDPTCATRRTTRASSLAELAGAISPCAAAPLATELEWSHLRADGSFHRCYWVAEWPRLEVGPSWLEPLLLHPGGTRTFTMLYEPIGPSRSQRQVDRDSTRFAADDEQRERTGFRIGARHRRVQAAVLEREAELVEGYAEFEFAGLLTVTASDEEGLARAAADYEQAAAQSGLELRPLYGRHDLALACSLPLGRGFARRRFA